MDGSTALRLAGRDALDLLHRISTNALLDLPPGSTRGTLFCDFRGRLLQRAVVARTADGAVWLLRADAPAAPLAELLERNLFREDVRVEDRSDEAPLALARDAAPGIAACGEERGVPVRIATADGVVLVRGAAAPDAAAYVARGLPRHGHEIVEAFTPFEVNLAHEVHLAKGCYPGQEALQRLVTYASVRRRLARVRLAGPPPATPAEVRAAGARAGTLTSAAADGDGTIALAVLATEALAAGAALALADGRALEVTQAYEPARPPGRA